MKAVVAAFSQEKALVGAFSVITNLRMDHFEALLVTLAVPGPVSSLRLIPVSWCSVSADHRTVNQLINLY